MVNFKKIEKKDYTGQPLNNYYAITGGDIDEIIDFCLPRIRTISQEFYKKEIKEDLSRTSESFIDVHAGMGVNYIIKLEK